MMSNTSTANDQARPTVRPEYDALHVATFRLGKHWFGIHVLDVQEVITTLPLTVVPLAPSYVLGLINVRGLILTSISLKSRLGLQDQDYDDGYHNIIINAEHETVCLAVDRIGDVIEADTSALVERPPTVLESCRQFIRGVIKQGDGLITLLDPSRLATA